MKVMATAVLATPRLTANDRTLTKRAIREGFEALGPRDLPVELLHVEEPLMLVAGKLLAWWFDDTGRVHGLMAVDRDWAAQAVADGTLTGVSLGYTVQESYEVLGKQVCTRIVPLEVSLCPRGMAANPECQIERVELVEP